MLFQTLLHEALGRVRVLGEAQMGIARVERVRGVGAPPRSSGGLHRRPVAPGVVRVPIVELVAADASARGQEQIVRRGRELGVAEAGELSLIRAGRVDYARHGEARDAPAQNHEAAALGHSGQSAEHRTADGIEAGAVLSLSQLEEIALKCSPSMLQSSLAVEQARISLANAKAGYLPTLSSSVGHSRSTRNTDRHSGTTHNNGAYNGGLNMSLTLYDFGRTSAGVRQAQDSLAAALKEYDQRRSAIVYGVRQAYFELRRAIELHAVAVESVGQYSDHLEQMKVKREIG